MAQGAPSEPGVGLRSHGWLKVLHLNQVWASGAMGDSRCPICTVMFLFCPIQFRLTQLTVKPYVFCSLCCPFTLLTKDIIINTNKNIRGGKLLTSLNLLRWYIIFVTIGPTPIYVHYVKLKSVRPDRLWPPKLVRPDYFYAGRTSFGR